MTGSRDDGRFIGIDVGTSAAKAVMLDACGEVLATASADYPVATPRPGWTEQDPGHWWTAVRHVVRDVVDRQGPPAALGLTGQMHGAVFLDRRDRVLRPALLWNDQRTAAEAEEIERTVGQARLREITGNPALTGFQAPKILWLRNQEPERWSRLARVLLPKDFVRLRLTGEAATDASDAAGTLLLDLAARDWSDDLLSALEIPRRWLPPVHEGPEVTGVVTNAAADALGLRPGTPVVAGAGDNAAAAVANGALLQGEGVISVGTSGVIFAPTACPRVDASGALHAFCHAAPGSYHLMGVMLSAGGSLQWAMRALGAGDDYEGLMSEAASVPAGAEGVRFLPYLAGERTPHMDPDARGAWVGLSLAHDRAHLIRSVLEGVAYGLREALDRVEAHGISLPEIRLVGGGMRSALWREIVVAALGRPSIYGGEGAGPASGAAILAAAGAGRYRSVAAAAEAMAAGGGDRVIPDPVLRSEYDRRRKGYAALYPALREVSEVPAASSSGR